MANPYKHLFSPGRMGRLTVKNRAVMTAMMLGFSGLDGEAEDRIIRFYAERAQGGVGAIITEGGVVDEETGVVRFNQLHYTWRCINGLERLAQAVHQHDTRILAQLWHGGNICNPRVMGRQTVSASDVPAIPGNIPRPLSVEEIASIVQKYIDAAEVCQQAGWDGVEVHAAHGYLLSQFLSPYFNHRTDEYGGSFENRVRIIDEILLGIRARAGAGFVISVRISADEMASTLGAGHMTLADGIAFAKHLDSLGIVDVLNISNGNKFTNNANCDPYYYQQGWKESIAKAIRESVGIPTIATNTIKTPQQAEDMLAAGVSDFAGIGRGHLADPEFMRKAYEGREDELRSCIGCLYCREARGGGQTSARCAINPRLGSEVNYPAPPKDGNGRAAVVIGGGPAGMQAALTLASRGFAVKLLEKAGTLGGTLNLASKPAFKDKLAHLAATMTTQIQKAGVEVCLGVDATPDSVAELHPSCVVLACGAQPIVPPIPGLDLPHVVTAEQVIREGPCLPGKVVLVGTGMTGLETAELLLENGSEVALVEMQDRIGPGLIHEILDGTLERLNRNKVCFYTGHKLVGVAEQEVQLVRAKDGNTVVLPADHVVLSLGVAPRRGLAEAWQQRFGPNLVVVGDALRGGRIYQAIHDGFTKAYSMIPYN